MRRTREGKQKDAQSGHQPSLLLPIKTASNAQATAVSSVAGAKSQAVDTIALRQEAQGRLLRLGFGALATRKSG